jgi:hypothetical protein
MRNNIVGGLLVLTGVTFTVAAFLPDYETVTNFGIAAKLYQFGFITGVSAVMTRLLIKDKA